MLSVCVHARSVQLCPTLCDLTDCSPPGSSVHGILQAKKLEWVAMSSSSGSSQPRDRTCASCISRIAGGFFFLWLRHGGKLQLLKSGTKLRAFYALLEFILTATLSGTNTENREFKMVVHITQLMRSGASTETPVGLTRHLDPTPWKDSAARTNRGIFCLAQLTCGNGSHSAIGSHHSQESQV